MVTIGEGCFKDTWFERIEVPLSVESIGKEAFSYTLHKHVIIPRENNIKHYGTNIFKYSNINEFIIPNNIKTVPGAMFFSCPELKTVEITFATSIDRYAFYNCTKLERIIVPEGCKSLGNFTFTNSSIESITLPSSLNYIGECAFQDCKKLVSINIPEKVTEILTKTFSHCEKIKNISLCNIRLFGEFAFDSCISLTNVAVQNYAEYSYCCFNNCTSIQYLNIGPYSNVDLYSFQGCTSLKTVILKTYCRMSSYVFEKCNNICSLVLLRSIILESDTFDSRLENKISVYYLDEDFSVSSRLEIFIKDVTVFNNFTSTKFFSLTPARLSEIDMIEEIQSINNGSYINACDLFVMPIYENDRTANIQLGGRYYLPANPSILFLIAEFQRFIP